MMKKLVKNNRGVTLVSLVITVVVILILTNVVIYNAAGNLRTTKLSNMQADIENLRDRVSTYYAQYGMIPANTSIEYTNINNINSISDVVDTGKFYVIDLGAMENITLNYGQDYEKIRNGEATSQEQINQLTDLYIINETSHNIFYVEGIEIDDERYYTDYSADDADKVAADLRYYDGVEIPDGFYYAGGTKDTGLVISDVQGDDLDNSKGGNQFVWIPVENESDYVRNTSYTDTDVSSATYTDTGYLPDGIQPTNDSSNYNEMAERQAVMRAKGFFISRFEAGRETINGQDRLVSKKGATVWNDISQANCKTTSKAFSNTDSVKSALCSGIQWDVTMNFVNGNQDGTGNTYDVTIYSGNRHTSPLVTAGQNEADRVCNIYDLEGSCWEYVAEQSSFYEDGDFVLRGGSYNYNDPASHRHNDVGDPFEEYSFRFVLYVIPRDNWTPSYDETTTYTDRNGDTATIPQGFSVSRKPNEKTIDDGLVVKDENGNEFVWVPLETVVSATETDGTTNKAMAIRSGDDYKGLLYDFTTSTSTVKSGCTTDIYTYREPEFLTAYDNNTNYNSGLFTKDSLQEDYNKMIRSVIQYHGFYIGRYELGLEGVSPAVKNASTNTNVTTVDASNSNTNIWHGLYSKCKEFAPESSDESVVSSMVWGSQYDAMLNWMQRNGVDVISRGTGNLTTTTGSSLSDLTKNIFDLYGCHYEWTLEANFINKRVGRGGLSNYSDAPSYRIDLFPDTPYNSASSRITLYIK